MIFHYLLTTKAFLLLQSKQATTGVPTYIFVSVLFIGVFVLLYLKVRLHISFKSAISEITSRISRILHSIGFSKKASTKKTTEAKDDLHQMILRVDKELQHQRATLARLVAMNENLKSTILNLSDEHLTYQEHKFLEMNRKLLDCMGKIHSDTQQKNKLSYAEVGKVDFSKQEAKSAEVKNPQLQNLVTHDIYYFPLPDPEGFFWNDQKSLIQQNSSAYCIELNTENPKLGLLGLLTDNEKMIKMALSNPTMYLRPVCSITDNNTKGSIITIIEKGLLRLSGDKWIIADDSKLKIRID